jgi:hypothetical protein
MAARHPFFDPDGAFRKMWHSIPPEERMRDYIRWLNDEKAQESRREGERKSHQYDSDYSLAAAERGRELVLALGTTVRQSKADFTRDAGHGGPFSRTSIRFKLPETGSFPDLAVPCTLLLLEPSALARILREVPKLGAGKGLDTEPTLRRTFASEAFAQYPVRMLLAGLPAVEGLLGSDGTAEFEIPVAKDQRFTHIGRPHLIAVVEAAG